MKGGVYSLSVAAVLQCLLFPEGREGEYWAFCGGGGGGGWTEGREESLPELPDGFELAGMLSEGDWGSVGEREVPGSGGAAASRAWTALTGQPAVMSSFRVFGQPIETRAKQKKNPEGIGRQSNNRIRAKEIVQASGNVLKEMRKKKKKANLSEQLDEFPKEMKEEKEKRYYARSEPLQLLLVLLFHPLLLFKPPHGHLVQEVDLVRVEGAELGRELVRVLVFFLFRRTVCCQFLNPRLRDFHL